jgi:dihydrofolate reductase
MPKLCVRNFSVSLDGYGAGPNQDLDNPIGVGGFRLHDWLFPTRSFRAMNGDFAGGETGVDDDFVAGGDAGIGATIMGRNMFGPIRGDWPDANWKGWWGDTPPYHHPVFVLTHHARAPIEMQGGTTFYFVEDGIEAALEQAMRAAEGKDVRIGGGVSTVQQYLRAGLIDELHLAVVPVLLGAGERLFDNLEGMPHGFECAELVCSGRVAHVRLVRGT